MLDDVPPTHQLTQLERDLAELEQGCDDADEVAARLRGDARLLAVLRQSGYRGRHTEEFVNELARYGLAVIAAWLRAGVLDGKAKQVGRPPRRSISTLTLTDDDRLAIADLTVAHGMALFRRTVFEKEQWRPDGGAGLKTFFIGACLLSYSNAVKAWRPDRRHQEIPSDSLDDLDLARAPDAADLATGRLSARETLDAIEDPLTREIVVAKSEGQTNKQIAESRGLTAGAVQMRLSRLRRRGGAAGSGGEEEKKI
jgi:DNA-binding CsgD family transcriptional regulator